jgi:2'-5' RNA ligase
MKGKNPHKTHRAAVVIIPPEEAWDPIQKIRRRHDRNVGRWMPHITLLYPFRPREVFEEISGQILEVCARLESFEVQLEGFDYFVHSPGSTTVWLVPEPKVKLLNLQKALQAAFPDCDDVSGHEGGYTPHLSVGQGGSVRQALGLLDELGTSWRTIGFRAKKVSLIYRRDKPDDVFRIHREFALGPAAQMDPSEI